MKEINASIVQAVATHQARISPMRPVSDVGWFWANAIASKMAQRTGICAWYDARRDAVVVPRQFKSMIADIMYAPTITHELTHAHQRKEMGLICYLMAKTFHRSNLEATAIQEEKRAQKILKVKVL